MPESQGAPKDGSASPARVPQLSSWNGAEGDPDGHVGPAAGRAGLSLVDDGDVGPASRPAPSQARSYRSRPWL